MSTAATTRRWLPTRKIIRWQQKIGVSSDKRRWPGHPAHLEIARFLIRRFLDSKPIPPASTITSGKISFGTGRRIEEQKQGQEQLVLPIFTSIPYQRKEGSIFRDVSVRKGRISEGSSSVQDFTRNSKEGNASAPLRPQGEEQDENSGHNRTRIHFQRGTPIPRPENPNSSWMSRGEYTTTTRRLREGEHETLLKKEEEKDDTNVVNHGGGGDIVHLTFQNTGNYYPDTCTTTTTTTTDHAEDGTPHPVVILANRPSEELYELANQGKDNAGEDGETTTTTPPPFIFLGNSTKKTPLDLSRLREGTTILEYPIQLDHRLLWKNTTLTNEMLSFATILGLNPYRGFTSKRNENNRNNKDETDEADEQILLQQQQQTIQKAWKYDDGLNHVREAAGLTLDKTSMTHLHSANGRRYAAIRLWARDRLLEEFYPVTQASPTTADATQPFHGSNDAITVSTINNTTTTTALTARNNWRMFNVNEGKPFYLMRYHPCEPSETNPSNGDICEEIPQSIMWLASFPSSSTPNTTEITITARQPPIKTVRTSLSPSTTSIQLDTTPKDNSIGVIMDCKFKITKKAKEAWCLKFLARNLVRSSRVSGNSTLGKVEVLFDDPLGEEEWADKKSDRVLGERIYLGNSITESGRFEEVV